MKPTSSGESGSDPSRVAGKALHAFRRWARIARRFRNHISEDGIKWSLGWVYRQTRLYRLHVRVIDRAAKLIGERRKLEPERVAPPVCDDLKAWCGTHPGSDVFELEPAQHLEWKLPNTIEPQPHERLLRIAAKHPDLPATNLVKLHKAKIRFGVEPLVILSDGQFVGETVRATPEWARAALRDDPAFFTPLPNTTRRKRGSYYLALNFFWMNYWHWVHQILMRLNAALDRLPPETKIIVPAGLSPLHYDSLELLGVHRERLRFFTGAGDEPWKRQANVWQVESLYFTNQSPIPTLETSAQLTGLRDKILDACNIRQPVAPVRRIYLTLRDTRRRRVVNEPDVEHCLHAYGFETWAPETMSLRDQVDLFSRSEIVVGPHGSAFVNLLFAPRGTSVLEIFEPQKVWYGFWASSISLQQDYWYILGNTVPNSDPTQEADIYAPINKLKATVERILERRDSPREEDAEPVRV